MFSKYGFETRSAGLLDKKLNGFVENLSSKLIVDAIMNNMVLEHIHGTSHAMTDFCYEH